jgi:hypothetical protein
MAWRVDPRRSSHVGPGVDYGYGGPGSTMAAPAEPTTLLSQRAGRRHSLGMHGRPKPTWLVTWCHIIAQTGQATAMCRHMTAFAATTNALWRRRASGRCHVSASHTDTLPEGHTNTRIQHANYVAERCTTRFYRILTTHTHKPCPY